MIEEVEEAFVYEPASLWQEPRNTYHGKLGEECPLHDGRYGQKLSKAGESTSAVIVEIAWTSQGPQ